MARPETTHEALERDLPVAFAPVLRVGLAA